MKDKTVLVTGGSGFIGAKIVERLVALDYAPSLILRKNSSRKRLLSILDKIKIFEADLQQVKAVSDIVKKNDPDIVIHLASYGVYSYSNMAAENVKAMVDVNINGTINLLHAIYQSKCKLLINTGSCFEYGSNIVPFKEDDMLNPVNAYGVSKAASTLFSQLFSKKNKFSAVTLRPFTVYGPGEDDRRFISTVIRQCFQRENPTLTSQRIVRDYIYIEDVVDAYINAIKIGEELSGEIINVSTGKGTVLEDVAEMIIRLMGVEGVVPDIGSFPMRQGEVLSLVGNVEKAEKLLRWKAKHSLEEGLIKTIAWIRQTLF